MNYGQANKIIHDSDYGRNDPIRYTDEMAAKQANPISPMQRSVEGLDKDVAVLQEVLTMLSQRLSIVTRPQPVDNDIRKEGTSVNCSPLVDRIDNIGKRVQFLTHSMRLQLELLEV